MVPPSVDDEAAARLAAEMGTAAHLRTFVDTAAKSILGEMAAARSNLVQPDLQTDWLLRRCGRRRLASRTPQGLRGRREDPSRAVPGRRARARRSVGSVRARRGPRIGSLELLWRFKRRCDRLARCGGKRTQRGEGL